MIYHKSVKTKFKTIFARCVLVLLMCMFCFTCTVGCSIFDGLRPSPNYGNNNEVGESDTPPTHPDHLPPPSDGDDEEDKDPDNMTEDEKDEATDGVSVDYVKVLRKPLSYDFTNNVTDKEGSTEGSRDYYNSFSEDILKWMFRVYGNFNTDFTILEYSNIFDEFYQITQNEKMNQLSADFQSNADNYLYWYDAIRYRISDVQPVYQDATDETKTTEDAAQAAVDTDGNPIIKSYKVGADTNKGWQWGLSLSQEDYLPWIINYGSLADGKYNYKITNTYKFDYDTFYNYYIKNEFVFDGYVLSQTAFSNAFINEDYKTALEYAIYNIVLGIEPHNITINYNSSTGMPSVSVEGYASTTGADAKTSAQVALADIKATFNRLGSYVGLTQKNKTQITNYILKKVIGEDLTGTNSSYAVKDGSNGTFATVDYCYEDVVAAIVDYCGNLTTIGAASDDEANDQTYIKDTFIASEVVDYPLLTFFSNNGYGDAFAGQSAYEYQSAVIIPSRETTITDLWLDFKYDAGNDGDNIYDPTKFLDITVSVRWNKGDGSPTHVTSQTIRVIDGPADVGDTSTLEFEFEPDKNNYLFGEPLTIGKFNTPDPLKTTAEQRVITISGLTDARRYYKVLESATYGGYGVLDESKFDCSYLEIAYSVAKRPGDTTTNYAFYTSIHQIWEDEEEDTSWIH